MVNKIGGFTIVELIAVLVITGVLAATAINKILPSDTFQLQASRDQVVTAFFSAQQQAMIQTAPVRLTTDGNIVDIRRNDNNDNVFSTTESIKVNGTQYPLLLLSNQQIDDKEFFFDRLGQTSAAVLTLSQNGKEVDITISEAGYAY